MRGRLLRGGGPLGAPGFLRVRRARARGERDDDRLPRQGTGRGGRLDGPALEEELVGAKQLLQATVGRPVTQAACPFGSYDRPVLRALRRSAYRYVYTSDRGAAPSDWSRRATRFAATTTPRRSTGSSPHGTRWAAARLTAKRWRWDDGDRAAPITSADAPRVGAFLNANLNPRVIADQWAQAVQVPGTVTPPTPASCCLDDEDEVVGAHLAFSPRGRSRRAACASATWARSACWRSIGSTACAY